MTPRPPDPDSTELGGTRPGGAGPGGTRPGGAGPADTGPADPEGVARRRLTPDPAAEAEGDAGWDAEWDAERMRRATPREIRLGPDGSRQDSAPARERPESPEPPEPAT